MRNVWIVFMLLFLTACGAEASQQLKGEYHIEYDTEIAKTKHVAATLVSLENKHDDLSGEYKEVTFIVENRSKYPVEVQAHNIYFDGKRIPQSSGIMSQEIQPGKKEECLLILQNYSQSKLPPLEEKIELELHIFSWEHDEINENYPVEIRL